MQTPITIEIMTKEDCCLCDDAKSIVEDVIRDFPVELKMIDIESDPDLFEQFKEKIPVVKINGKESFVYKVHPITLRKKLEKIVREAN
jgi:glutaredoxin